MTVARLPLRVLTAQLLACALIALAGVGAAPASAAGTPSPGTTPDPALEQTISGDQAVASDPVVLDAGHVDVGPWLEDGAWTLLAHDDTSLSGSVWRDPSRTVLRVGDAALQEVPDDPTYAFLGVAPGTRVHVVPQTQDPAVVWVGWNTQDPAVMDSVDRGVTLRMTDVEGPGDVVVFLQDGGFGDPDVLWDSRHAASGSPDEIFVDVNTHTHANWVFTEPGVYLVSMQATAQLLDGSTVDTTGTLRFAVGDATSTQDAMDAVAPAPRTVTSSRPPDGGSASAAGGSGSSGAGSTGLLVGGGGALVVLLAAVFLSLRSRGTRRRALEEA